MAVSIANDRFVLSRCVGSADNPATYLIAEGHCDMVQEGLCVGEPYALPINKFTDIFYVSNKSDGDVVGVLCVDYGDLVGKVILGYVEPSSRRQGAFTMMWREAAKAAKVMEVEVHSRNEAAKAFLAKLKNEPVAARYMVQVN